MQAAVAGVRESGQDVPVTVKMRVGISEALPTFLEVRATRACDCRWHVLVPLHQGVSSPFYPTPLA